MGKPDLVSAVVESRNVSKIPEYSARFQRLIEVINEHLEYGTIINPVYKEEASWIMGYMDESLQGVKPERERKQDQAPYSELCPELCLQLYIDLEDMYLTQKLEDISAAYKDEFGEAWTALESNVSSDKLDEGLQRRVEQLKTALGEFLPGSGLRVEDICNPGSLEPDSISKLYELYVKLRKGYITRNIKHMQEEFI